MEKNYRQKFKENIKLKGFTFVIPVEILAKMKIEAITRGVSEADIVRELLYQKYGLNRYLYEK